MYHNKEIPYYISVIKSRVDRIERQETNLIHKWDAADSEYARELLKEAEGMLQVNSDERWECAFSVMKKSIYQIEADFWLGAMGVLCYELEG